MKRLVASWGLLGVVLLFLSSCIANNSGRYRDPYNYPPRPYYHDGYHRGDYDRYRHRDRIRDERRELEKERRELERERERLERERKRHKKPQGHYWGQGSSKKKDDRCPAGYFPRDRKCSSSERKNGCRDTRAPSGRLCVDPGWGYSPKKRHDCPSGFSPSGKKCTDKERKKGCKDTRSQSGVLCVQR